MENLFFFLATSFVLRLSPSRKFKNYFIGNTGCSALLFARGSDLDKAKTKSGDDLYFYEFSEKDVTYGLICIELKEEHQLDESTKMLKNYINKLRDPFYILHNIGLSPDKNWNSIVSGAVIDYWQDNDGFDWKVKGYADGRHIAVLYVKNIGQAEVKKQDLFLNSFHFKGSC